MGFIGKALTQRLLARGWDVTSLQKGSENLPGVQVVQTDLQDAEFLKKELERVKPDFVLHLASYVKPGRNLKEDELEAHYKNTVQASINLAYVVPESTRLSMFFGSCEEYGNGPTPFQENQALIAFSPYGWAKISAFHATQLIARNRKLQFAWVRPFLTFGPGQKSDSVIPYVLRECLAGNEVKMTLGEQTRDFIFIEDVCGLIEMILSHPEKAAGEVINLCSGLPIRIRDVAELIQKLVGKGKVSFGAIPYRSNEAMSFFGSTEKFKKLFGPYQLTPLEIALKKTIEGSKV
jgi:nucleoside-diphosphate-sugar epimerase